MKGLILAGLLCFPASLSQSQGSEFIITAYCPCAKCCGEAGKPTASGKLPRDGITVAGPRSLPFGTRLYIEGLGERVVEDRQARRFDNQFDVFFPDHQSAKAFGKRKLQVRILN